MLKLVAIPAIGLRRHPLALGRPRSSASPRTPLNQLDTRPGRALKAFLLGGARSGTTARRGYAAVAVLLLPYDLRERVMLGDAGSNALGAVVGLGLVARLTDRGR